MRVGNLWCVLAGVWFAGPAFADGQELFTDGHGHFTTRQAYSMEGYVESVAGRTGGFGDVTGLVLGVVPSEGEVPVVGAEVFLFLLADNHIIGQGTTDATGVYTINQMPAGEHGLYVTVTGFEDQFAPVLVVADQVAEQDLLLGSAEPCTTCAFQDVTVEAGLGDYVAATGDGHGPGAVFADLNNDGYPELYLMRAAGRDGTNPSANQLYVNTDGPGGTRRFVLASAASGAGDEGNATGAIAGDYDNDGDLDLYVLNFDQPNALLQNQWAQTGVLEFVDVTANTDPTPGVADDQFGVGIAFFEGIALDNSLTAAWADIDRDGDLDLYVGNHNGYFGDVVEGPLTVPGRRDILYLNNGDDTFTDITMETGVTGYISEDGFFQTPSQSFSSTNAVIFADFNNDRWPDLLVTNKVGGPPDRDMLYINRGSDGNGDWLGFDMVTYNLSPAFGHVSGAAMGVDVADVDNDGDLDIYITDWSPPFNQQAPGPNDLWLNGFANTGILSFTLVSGLPAKLSWGTVWQDFDNDGHLDLHVATAGSFRDYFYSNVASGVVEAAIELGVAQVRNGRGDPSADFDRDGWADLFVVNIDGGPSVLYQNSFLAVEGSTNHYLVVKLVGDPSITGPLRSTRDAIGARVYLTADLNQDGQLTPDETQLREVVSGSGNAGSSSSLDLEFGLGLATTATLEVHWPSGLQETIIVQGDQFLVLTEGTADSIPTVSEWGLIVMALLLLTTASIVLSRRWLGMEGSQRC